MTYGEAWQAARDANVPWPENLAAPAISDWLVPWYEAFWELSTERQTGFGAGTIPKSAIDAHVSGWAWDDAEVFRIVIRDMDHAYLCIVNKVDKAPPPQSARDAFRSGTKGRRK